MMHITFIGGGNMATAIIAGLTKARGCQISVVEPNADKRAQLAQQFGVTTQEQLPVYFGSGQIVVLAVKPQQLREVCGGLASRLDGALVLSIAAGVGVSALSRWLDGHERIVRIMPNTPAMIGKGVAGLYAPRGVDEQDRDAAQRIMAAAGSTVWLDEESGIDDITAISGSGPAYVFYFIEGLIDAARQMGFDDATAAASAGISAGLTPLLLASPETFTCRQTCKSGMFCGRCADSRSAIFRRSMECTQCAHSATGRVLLLCSGPMKCHSSPNSASSTALAASSCT